MTPQSELELQGNFLSHPFAELIAEIAQERLTGSLRLSDKDKKCVVYFKSGLIVFAVSNSRASRLFSMVLQRGKIKNEDLAKIPNFVNDFEFAAFLQDEKYLDKQECDRLFVEQIEDIIVDILMWTDGNWTFSSLARIRDGLAFQVDTTRLLIDYGRTLAVDKMLLRFRSLRESFSFSENSSRNTALTPEEAFVLSRANATSITAQDLVSVTAMSEPKALQLIYTLWLGGLLERDAWQQAFSKVVTGAMRNAKLEIRREAKVPVLAASENAEKESAAVSSGTEDKGNASKGEEQTLTVEEYLKRIEDAETHYDILGVDPKADLDELKRAYFFLAKNFHPDRFHADGGPMLKRIQNAFTTLAQAHETLKNQESREVYDYRIRKELLDREKREAAGNAGKTSLQSEQAELNFDRGFSLLMENEADAAVPFLARAVHFAPNNARYHAYYGKALSFDTKQRHKAESEMQAALRIDSDNQTFRLMLVEFFIKENLVKRAEGELTRLLAVSPDNREARAMLDSLKARA